MAKHKNFYDLETERIQEKMMQYEVGSESYKKCQADLKELIAMRGNDKESKRRISKGDKGQLLIKGLGITGILAAIIGMSKFEHDGNCYTGEKKRWIDTLVGNLGRFNLFG